MPPKIHYKCFPCYQHHRPPTPFSFFVENTGVIYQSAWCHKELGNNVGCMCCICGIYVLFNFIEQLFDQGGNIVHIFHLFVTFLEFDGCDVAICFV